MKQIKKTDQQKAQGWKKSLRSPYDKKYYTPDVRALLEGRVVA